ncbi:alkylation response protein AidB-like acyl-CoA dehydrogenase [Georgenia soli]|uniref:Alkylation response protein AidB-like acyl-CoA dehydrogenase n=1 Tax=Georgenia soli TaxID=638953 RepID=A0A2A9ENJ7_9MICO|nr:hydroxylase [Georgenia soli]PFG39825.1 alkylation response protein AidB-like acyl-CoA dehydrogenase [Georgenia soli]
MNSVLDAINHRAQFFAADAPVSNRLGRLTDEAASALRAVGIMRMLQPARFGGFESHPVDFLRAVHRLASISPSAGWVSGVVGLHPWEVGQFGDETQSEVWGADPDTWIASPYAPMGRATSTPGGYTFSGQWSFSSGTDHCTWAILGGLDVSKRESPLHFLIPRRDYEILDGTWDVAGLEGTGSKDVRVSNAFVPTEHVLAFRDVSHGNASERWIDVAPLYRMPYVVLFPGAITAATLGITQGALEQYLMETGTRPKSDAQLISMAESAETIESAARILFDDVERTFDTVSAGKSVPIGERIRIRRNQVSGVRKAVAAVNELHRISGSVGLRNHQVFSRFWRDANVGANHATNSAEPILRGYGLHRTGQEVPEVLRMGTAPEHDAIPALATNRS